MKATITLLIAFTGVVHAMFFTLSLNTQKGSVRMQEQSKVVSDLSKLTDDDYLKQRELAAIEIPRNALRNRFKGLALGVPTRFSIDSYDRLPFLLFSGESATRSKQLPLTKNAIVVVADLGSG